MNVLCSALYIYGLSVIRSRLFDFSFIIITILCFGLSPLVKAQTTDKDKFEGMQLINSNREQIGLSVENSHFIISSSYKDISAGGIQLVYLQETYKGIPVYNQFQSLSFRDGKLVTNSGSLPQYFKRVKDLNDKPALTAAEAVKYALEDRQLKTHTPTSLIKSSENGQKFEFLNKGISEENITAQLMWVPSEDAGQLFLAWQVYVVPFTTSDYWLVRIDAMNGLTLGVSNLTVYCNWGTSEHNIIEKNKSEIKTFRTLKDNHSSPLNSGQLENHAPPAAPLLVNSASYLVIKYPTEAPSFGAESVHTDPWNQGPAGNATTHKWHFDGVTNYTISRGNNVWAKEDRDGLNNTIGLPATSTTGPDPLTFQFIPDYNVEPTNATFQQFAITNLFYWNNLMHDMSYNYGFDEVAANFQADNLGRGGIGNDYVNADAQDGAGTNNANFSTPADGSKGRMQMYLWTSPTPDRDGDLDNGIICHEYGHGISHRLTGGPGSGAGCMSHVERGDEGWSDYFGLMMNTNWSTATLTDGFNIPRGIGTYALNQPTNGAGIRLYKYCTNMAVNPLTYANMGVAPVGTAVHNIGEIWCATLWDMTWDLIQLEGINPNLFNASGAGGNTVAMKLVIMGEKLQKCSPGFLDARDAILQADQLLYNGQYHCTILNAFARRGMGTNAIQGSSGSATDHTAGFLNEESTLQLTQSVSQQLQNGQVTYTHTVKSFCQALTNYVLRDTLPLNVTYISGGTYNPVHRVVSFTVNLGAASVANYSYTVSINPGTYFVTTDLINEVVTTPAIPSNWSVSSNNSTNWTGTATASHSAPNSLFGTNQDVVSDMLISMNTNVSIPSTAPFISFWHNYNTEAGWDGGVVEMSTDNGTTWVDLGPYFTSNAYNGNLGTGSNLAGRNAFTGNSNGWIKSTIRHKKATNTNARIRFRLASDSNTKVTGWNVDDIVVRSRAVVDIVSELFYSSGQKAATSDTFTKIIFPVITAGTATGTISACEGSPSVAPDIQSFTVSANSLISGLTITAPAHFEVSLQPGSNYTSSLVINPTDTESIPATLIYVRSSASAPAGLVSGMITLNSSLATTISVPVNGIVNMIPVAMVSPQDQSVCSSIPITPIIPTSNIAGSQYNWTRNNTTNVTGIGPNGSGNITGVLNNIAQSAQMVTFNIIPVSNGCQGLPVIATITVYSYNTINNGYFNDPGVWEGGCVPPQPLPAGAKVTINHDIIRQ